MKPIPEHPTKVQLRNAIKERDERIGELVDLAKDIRTTYGRKDYNAVDGCLCTMCRVTRECNNLLTQDEGGE